MKICIISQSAHGSCSWYRTMGVLPYTGAQVSMPEYINWPMLAAHGDILFLERPSRAEDLQAAKIAAGMNVPIWCDIDDDFTSIPDYNPAHRYYSDRKVLRRIKEILELASVLTVTTPALAEVFAGACRRIEVVPNAFNDHVFSLQSAPNDERHILWRGSRTHRQDLQLALPELRGLHDEGWRFTFVSDPEDAWWIQEALPTAVIVPLMDHIRYFEFLRSVDASVIICPLVDNQFNRAKSNIAWQEGMHAGAVCVASALPEFDRPGVTLYKSGELEEAIRSAYDNRSSLFELSATNMTRLSIINQQRKNIMEALCQRY